jgi:hypothetical protein
VGQSDREEAAIRHLRGPALARELGWAGIYAGVKKKRDNPIDKITRQARLGDLR